MFGVDSESSRSPTPGPREVIVIDPNENECMDGLPVHLRYDWTGANPRHQYVSYCEVNNNLFLLTNLSSAFDVSVVNR